MSKYTLGAPSIEGLRLGLAISTRLNDAELLQQAYNTYKDDDELGTMFQSKHALLQAFRLAIGSEGKMSIQEWSSLGKLLGIYTE